MSVWGRIILLHFFIIVNPHRRNSSTPAGVLTSIDSKEIISIHNLAVALVPPVKLKFCHSY